LGWVVRIRSKESKTKGWQARIPYGKTNPATKSRRFRSKLFSDAIYGGSEKARRAALRWLKTPDTKAKPKSKKTAKKAKSRVKATAAKPRRKARARGK